jgi:hypothetical protein
LGGGELRIWARHFGITQGVLKRVVGKVGNPATAVRKELDAKGKKPH